MTLLALFMEILKPTNVNTANPDTHIETNNGRIKKKESTTEKKTVEALKHTTMEK